MITFPTCVNHGRAPFKVYPIIMQSLMFPFHALFTNDKGSHS